MGQTLTHGIYLPDEGERNCYDGLAANWQLLDGAVGTIAEHSTQIAGKAPAVHTHTKADITDFPAYGNSAGTICEGNDSRLSDARTPVAHTHSKADVTGLLNSNFIPSANNSYDLGSSSYQWNNLYAKKTYTDTVKAATGILTLQANGTNNSIAIYNGTSSADGGGIWLYGKDHSNGSSCRIQIYNTSKSRYERVDLVNSQFLPALGEINLGTSTNKWKTLNGINPGALSLPSGGTTENTDWFNVAGDILPTGGNATSFSIATANYFTPAKDGWLALAVKQCSELSVWCANLKYGISIVAPDASLNRQVVIPVVAGEIYQILITGNSWASARLIMPKGNV